MLAFSICAAALIAALLSLGPPASGWAADVEAGRRKAEPCAVCHGPRGHSTNPMVPSLAGQPAFYVHWQLILFRDNRRIDPQMSPFVEHLSEADMADLAAYYAAQPPAPPPETPGDPNKIAAGRRLAEAHHCGACHRPGMEGPDYVPRLTGLSYEYLAAQLRKFKAKTRGELDTTMTTAAQPLSDEDIEALAHYLTGVAVTPTR